MRGKWRRQQRAARDGQPERPRPGARMPATWKDRAVTAAVMGGGAAGVVLLLNLLSGRGV